MLSKIIKNLGFLGSILEVKDQKNAKMIDPIRTDEYRGMVPGVKIEQLVSMFIDISYHFIRNVLFTEVTQPQDSTNRDNWR